jgi:hypothetical protein
MRKTVRTLIKYHIAAILRLPAKQRLMPTSTFCKGVFVNMNADSQVEVMSQISPSLIAARGSTTATRATSAYRMFAEMNPSVIVIPTAALKCALTAIISFKASGFFFQQYIHRYFHRSSL